MDELTTIQKLTEAIQERAWYPVIGYVMTLLIGVLRIFDAQGWWQTLPKAAKPVPALVLAVISSFVAAFTSGETWEVALGVALYTLLVTAPVAWGVADGGARLAGMKKGQKDG